MLKLLVFFSNILEYFHFVQHIVDVNTDDLGCPAGFFLASF